MIGMDRDTAPDKTEREAVTAHIEALAQAKAPEIVAKSAEALALFEADHATDSAVYEFRCQRWGDFLTLMMHRQQPEPMASWYRPPPEKTVVAVNLGESAGIYFREGRAPDAFGEAKFSPYVDDGSGGGAVIHNGYGPDLSWPKTGKWAVRVEAPHSVPIRHTITVPNPPSKDGKGGSMMGYGYSSYSAKFTMPHARPAEDDVIEFANGVKVYAPAGLGQGVFDQIMAAIANGSPPR